MEKAFVKSILSLSCIYLRRVIVEAVLEQIDGLGEWRRNARVLGETELEHELVEAETTLGLIVGLASVRVVLNHVQHVHDCLLNFLKKKKRNVSK